MRGRLGGAAVLAGTLLAGPVGAEPLPCPESLPDLYERVSPAVVSIAAASVNPYDVSEQVSRVVGAGFIVDPAGLILTNSHLVFGRQMIGVTLDDGTGLIARLVGADPIFDIALLRVTPPAGRTLAAVALGDSDRVRVGDEVLAIGNPMGFQQTLTRGILSAVNRKVPNVPFSLTEPLLQTDAPINPGNSGGPLVSRCGEVLGMTTATLPNAQSIGFAIPVNLAREVSRQLLADGRVIRPWLGVQGQLVSAQLKELLRAPLVDGFLVEGVEPGSPAEAAGLRGGSTDLVVNGHPVLVGGDIITAIDGTALRDASQLAEVLGRLHVGTRSRLSVTRAGKQAEVTATLTERPLLPSDVSANRGLSPSLARDQHPFSARTGF